LLRPNTLGLLPVEMVEFSLFLATKWQTLGMEHVSSDHLP